jgi:hypothetical protein
MQSGDNILIVTEQFELTQPEPGGSPTTAMRSSPTRTAATKFHGDRDILPPTATIQEGKRLGRGPLAR